MKPPLVKLKPTLEKEMLKVIEDFATAEYNPATVRIRIFDAAKNGQSALRLKTLEAFDADLRKTEAARRLEAWCRENDLRITWESRVVEKADGRRVTVFEPEISWHPVVL